MCFGREQRRRSDHESRRSLFRRIRFNRCPRRLCLHNRSLFQPEHISSLLFERVIYNRTMPPVPVHPCIEMQKGTRVTQVHICRSFGEHLNRSSSQSLPQYCSCSLARMFCLLFRNGQAAIVNTRWNIDFTLHFIIQR